MKNLNPTLWRTCRMLAGPTRIHLLRAIHERPGLAVGQLAKVIGIGRSDASQELRRIQSRGLLKSERHGALLIYRMEPDPQVASAAPLLKALRAALAYPAVRDVEIWTLANGLAYPRRIAIAQALLASPRTEIDLCAALNLSSFAIYAHAKVLRECGWVQRNKGLLRLAPPRHPLAGALLGQLQTA